MTRRSRLPSHPTAAAALLAVLLAPLPAQSTTEVETPARKRPNILLIVADDQSPFDLRAYRPDSELETPVLDQLAARGMVLDAAYHMGSWSGAVCTPSRHMIMSGRTVWHLPSRGIQGEKANPNCPQDLPQNTLAAVFNRAGYDTMRTCKRGNSYKAANEQFTVRHEKTNRKGTPEDGSAWHADRVLEFLAAREAAREQGADGQNPFLIYFGFSHPHDPRNGPDDLLDKYGATNAPGPGLLAENAPSLPPNYLPAHPFPHGHPRLRDEISVQGVGRKRDMATIRNEIGRQFACSEHIDRQVGRVLDKLRTMGELDNTYVIYTADHGMAIGRHGLQGKQNLYEHTWRVPLIVAGPGVTPGVRAPGNVYLLDLLDTLCDLAGVQAPKTTEGSSFADVLRGGRQTVRDVMYGVYCGGTKPGMRAVRKGRWKLIEYDTLDGLVRQTQLFDLEANPHEFLLEHHVETVQASTGAKPGRQQVDLAEDPEYAEILAEMRGLLRREMERLEDPYRLWNQDGQGDAKK